MSSAADNSQNSDKQVTSEKQSLTKSASDKVNLVALGSDGSSLPNQANDKSLTTSNDGTQMMFSSADFPRDSVDSIVRQSNGVSVTDNAASATGAPKEASLNLDSSNDYQSAMSAQAFWLLPQPGLTINGNNDMVDINGSAPRDISINGNNNTVNIRDTINDIGFAGGNTAANDQSVASGTANSGALIGTTGDVVFGATATGVGAVSATVSGGETSVQSNLDSNAQAANSHTSTIDSWPITGNGVSVDGNNDQVTLYGSVEGPISVNGNNDTVNTRAAVYEATSADSVATGVGEAGTAAQSIVANSDQTSGQMRIIDNWPVTGDGISIDGDNDHVTINGPYDGPISINGNNDTVSINGFKVLPEPTPVPEPTPLPEPVPVLPEPTPGSPEPTPTPEPTPLPKPVPVLPEPTPGSPEPTPTPEPTPLPKPVPVLPEPTPGSPEPTPTPEPTPLPKPVPVLPEPTPGSPEPTPTPAGPSGDNGFTIQDGKLLVNGKPLSGVAVDSRYAQQVGPQTIANQIATDFPGINVVRFATSPDGGIFTQGKPYAPGTYDGKDNESVADINAMIQAFNAKGIAVVIDNHGSDASTANNVSQDGNEASWFAQLAKDNLNNNMVMFQTQNEPTSTDWRTGSNSTAADMAVAKEQQAVYDAIRATGSKAIVAFEQEHGVPNEMAPFQDDASAYNSDYNYVIDAHDYGSASSINGMVSDTSFLKESNGGKVPVYFGETGNSGAGTSGSIDSGADALLQAVWSSGDGGIAWEYNPLKSPDWGTADNMTNNESSTLNSYGQEIAALIAE